MCVRGLAYCLQAARPLCWWRKALLQLQFAVCGAINDGFNLLTLYWEHAGLQVALECGDLCPSFETSTEDGSISLFRQQWGHDFLAEFVSLFDILTPQKWAANERLIDSLIDWTDDDEGFFVESGISESVPRRRSTVLSSVHEKVRLYHLSTWLAVSRLS